MMLLCYQDFIDFANLENLVGTDKNKFTRYFSQDANATFIAYDSKDGREGLITPDDVSKVNVFTMNSVESRSNSFIYLKTFGAGGAFSFGVVFRYGSTGGLALYRTSTEFKLISFTTSNPFSSPTVVADLSAYLGHIHDDIWISANGTTIKIYLHGELISTVTTSVTQSGLIGFICYADDWGIRDYAVESFTGVLMAPSGLTVTALSATSAQLSWTNNIPDAGQILIEKKIGTGSWSQIDTAPGDATSYIDDKLDSNLLNTYRIRSASNPNTPELYWLDHFEGTPGDYYAGDWTGDYCDLYYGSTGSQIYANSIVEGMGAKIYSPFYDFSNVYRRLQIKIDEYSGNYYQIQLRNDRDETWPLYGFGDEPPIIGTLDFDFAKLLWEAGQNWRDTQFCVEILIDGDIKVDMVKVYNLGLYNNLDTCYFQDFFEDTDGTPVGDLGNSHLPDINRVDAKFVDLTGGSWVIQSNKLICLYPPDDGSFTIDTTVRSYKQSVSITIVNPADFDYKFTVDKDKQFHIKNDGLWLMHSDSVILLHDPNWVPVAGTQTIYIEVHPFFISLTVGSTILKYFNTYTPDTVFGIGTDSSEDVRLSNIIFQQYKVYSDYSSEATLTVTTLTIQEIWERYSELKYERGIYVKRIDENGVYESDWQNVNDLFKLESRLYDVCNDISYALPNNTYSLGAVTIDNANLKFANQAGQFSNENAPNSIFHNFVRHKSLIKIVDSFIDFYTYPGSFGKVSQTTFEGFIDDRLCVTNTNDTETIIATDILGTLLKSITIAEMGLTTDQTIQNLVYQVMNRTLFTAFFTVSLSNIVPGFNATNIDLTEYDQSATAFDLLQELSIGHSIFYVRNGVFYYKADNPTASVILHLGETPQRKIKFNNYNTGGAAVYDKLYWQDAVETYISPTRTYNQSFAFSTKGIDHPTQRQGLLNYAGPRLSQAKTTFELSIPFLPILFILDRITILHRGTLQEGCFILDISRLDEGYFLEPVGAFVIPATDQWKIKKIKHSANNQTTMTLEKIL